MKLRSLVLAMFVVPLCGVGALVACSTDDSSAASSGGPSQSGTTTVRVTAAQGGTVTDPAGKVSLAIPPGALEKDTDITLKVAAAESGSAGEVFDFGPDGLKFLKPAVISVTAAGVTPPEGKAISVAYLEGTTWKPIAGSAVTSGVATANVEHFTKFSIVLVDGKAVLTPPADCEQAASTFVACGGDPTGTWKFANFCVDPKTLGSDPFKGTCPQAAATAEVTWDSTVTITGTASSGTQVVSSGTQTLSYEFTFPLSCATSASDGGITACNQAFTKPGDPTCTDTGGGNCTCSKSSSNPQAASTRNYTTSGNLYTSTDPTNNSTSTGEYCVKGNLLYFKEIKDGGSGLLYVLNRVP